MAGASAQCRQQRPLTAARPGLSLGSGSQTLAGSWQRPAGRRREGPEDRREHVGISINPSAR